MLGFRLMPHQQQILDVALEYDPDTGLYRYREVVETVPRQTGKTTGKAVAMSDRCVVDDGARVAFTAQDGTSAHKKMVNDIGPMIKRSDLGKQACGRLLRGVGFAALEWRNGSRIDVISSADSAGHGDTIDMAVIDEAFKDTDNRREQAFVPAMSTRPNAQLWVSSTAGTHTSRYLRRKVERGRRSVEEGTDGGLCYFEWSAPEEADPYDPETWRACHPALGYTIEEETIAYWAGSLPEGEFRRAYLNQWTEGTEQVLPEQTWLAVCDPGVAPTGRMTFAVAVAQDRASAAIGVADQQGRCEVVDYRAGTGWLVDRVNEVAPPGGGKVVLDFGGPAGALADQIKRCGKDERLSGSDVMTACARFYDAVADQQGISVRSDDDLAAAVRGAAQKRIGDRWVWSRTGSANDIAPLEAVTLAWHVATSGPAYQKPMGAAR